MVIICLINLYFINAWHTFSIWNRFHWKLEDERIYFINPFHLNWYMEAIELSNIMEMEPINPQNELNKHANRLHTNHVIKIAHSAWFWFRSFQFYFSFLFSLNETIVKCRRKRWMIRNEFSFLHTFMWFVHNKKNQYWYSEFVCACCMLINMVTIQLYCQNSFSRFRAHDILLRIETPFSLNVCKLEMKFSFYFS